MLFREPLVGEKDLSRVSRTRESSPSLTRWMSLERRMTDEASGRISFRSVSERLMKTATCPTGRNHEINGYALKINDMLAQLDDTCYITRQSINKIPASAAQYRHQSSRPGQPFNRRRSVNLLFVNLVVPLPQFL